MEEKEEQLQKIREKVKNCRKCLLYKTANLPVPGEGSSQARIFFIGEAPGYWEDQQGRPFVGRAGKLLDESLESIGLSRDEVFIGNVLKHRPPNNRDPLPEEVKACQQWLDEQLEIIQPEIIVTLGRFSLNKFLPGSFISQVHGQPRWVDYKDKRYLIFPMYHPAAALRRVALMEEFKNDFAKLKEVLNNKDKEEKIKPTLEIDNKEEQLTFL